MIDFEKEYREKMMELVPYIGKVCNENFSPTHRAKLVSMDIDRNIAVMEVVSSPYISMVQGGPLNEDKVGETYVRPLNYVWNAFLF